MCVCVCVSPKHTRRSHSKRQSGHHLFSALHPINSPSTADRVCSGAHAWPHTLFTPLPLMRAFPPSCIRRRVYPFVCVLYVCIACVSNDAVGHDRRWHLLLMVTPAQGVPRGRAAGTRRAPRAGPRQEKTRRKGGGGGALMLTPIHPTLGENTH